MQERQLIKLPLNCTLVMGSLIHSIKGKLYRIAMISWDGAPRKDRRIPLTMATMSMATETQTWAQIPFMRYKING